MKQYLNFGGAGSDSANTAILANNFDWMESITYLEFLRDVGKNFPVGGMLGKESVRGRD